MEKTNSGEELLEPDLSARDVHPDDCSIEQDMIEEEISQYEMTIDRTTIRPTKYKEGYMIKPKVGGLHFGKVPVKLGVSQGAKYTLSFPRMMYLFQSIQGYIPMLKRLSMKVGINRLKKLGALPAMITNLLVSNTIHPSTVEEKEEIDQLLECLMEVFDNLEAEIDATQGNNCVRLEGFFESYFKHRNKDWKFPEIQWTDVLLISPQMGFFKTTRGMCKEVKHALKRTFLDNPKEVEYKELSSEAKGMLVLMAEMAVVFSEFQPFTAKCMNQVTQYIKSNQREAARRRTEAEQVGNESQILGEGRSNLETEAVVAEGETTRGEGNGGGQEEDANQGQTNQHRGENPNSEAQDESIPPEEAAAVSQESGASIPPRGRAQRRTRRNQATREQRDGSFRGDFQSLSDDDDEEYNSEEEEEEVEEEEDTFEEIVVAHPGIWNIPKQMLHLLPWDEQKRTGLRWGIKNVVMLIPEFKPVQRLSEDDMKTRDTSCMQVFINESSDMTNLMNHYVYVCNRVLGNMWHYQLMEKKKEYRPNVFELPDFSVLAGLTFSKKKSLLESICFLVFNVYDFEWWHIVRDRIIKYLNNENMSRKVKNFGGAEMFPTTIQEVKQFFRQRPFLPYNKNDNPPRIETIGKS